MGTEAWRTDIGRLDYQPAPRCTYDPPTLIEEHIMPLTVTQENGRHVRPP